MDQNTVDLILSADPSILITLVKNGVFALLVGAATTGFIEWLKEAMKARGAEWPALLPKPLVSGIVGMLLMGIGLLVLGGPISLLGRYMLLGLATGFGATGTYALVSATSSPSVAVAVPGELASAEPFLPTITDADITRLRNAILEALESRNRDSTPPAPPTA